MKYFSVLAVAPMMGRSLLLSIALFIGVPAMAQMAELSSDVAADAQVWIESPVDGKEVS